MDSTERHSQALVAGFGRVVDDNFGAHPGAELVAADLGSSGFVDQIEGFSNPAFDVVVYEGDVLHVIEVHRLGGVRVAVVVGEDEPGRLTLPASVSGRTMRSLGDQALVVDFVAAIPADQYIVTGRRGRGERLHAVGMRSVRIGDVADLVVQNLDSVTEKAYTVVVTTGRVVYCGVLQREVISFELDTGSGGADDAEALHDDMEGYSGGRVEVQADYS